jgi:hypothetical protein
MNREKMSSVYFILPLLMAIGNKGSEGGDAGSGDSEGGDAGGGDAGAGDAGSGDAGAGDAKSGGSEGGDAGSGDAEGSHAGVDDAGGGEDDEGYLKYLQKHKHECENWDKKVMARVKSGTWWPTIWGPLPICRWCHSGNTYNKETGVCEACVSFQSQMFTKEAVAETQASVAKFKKIKKILQNEAIAAHAASIDAAAAAAVTAATERAE